jgi:hypothetical protein
VSRDEEQIDWFDLGSAGEPGSDKPPRQPWPRWFTLAVIAAVVVAFGLAALNHQRRAGSATPATTPTTSASSTRPATPSPSMTVSISTVVPSPSTVSITRVGHPLLGTTAGWELFGRGEGVLVRIELAAGRITRTTIPGLQSSGPAFLVAGSDRVVIRTLDDEPSYLVSDGKPARELSPSLIQGGQVFPGPASNQIWVVAPSDNLSTVMVLSTLDGARLAGSIRIPPESSAFNAVADGAGYLLVTGVGGIYDARPGSLHRITTGSLLAVGPTGWLVLECDEQHRCQPLLVNRVDGSRRVLHVNAVVEQLGLGVISADGSTAAMVSQGSESGLGVYLLDLASGKRRELGIMVNEQTYGDNFAFSPDGRWLFVVNSFGTLVVVNCRTGAVGDLGVPLPDLKQLVVRPAR